jgi:hypothetical protein
MPFVHGHARESGWVMSHYRRPQRAGDEQLDLVEATELPAPRDGDQVCETTGADEADPDDPGSGEPDSDDPDRASVRSIPRRTASTR